ncbi:DMT family transporter [Glutamicibacter sp.]|uniref:DMT family transporter n=1 Tax=Glutamicibacter sp. TaxID=1931995 RepID=UPI0028BDCD81|nr:DMT family transporter [Glutamicibacter sp.]
MSQTPTTASAKAGEPHVAARAAGLWLGVLVVALAVLWQGIGTAVVAHVVDPRWGTFATFSAFLSASIIAVLIYAVRSRRGQAQGRAVRIRPTEWVKLNLVTAGAFACFYVAATMIPATAASVIETGLGPIAVTTVAYVQNRGRNSAKSLLYPAWVLLAACAVAWFVFAAQESASAHQLAGILLSVVAGSCAAGVLLISRQLAQRGVSALSMSVARFHLAWIICGALSLPALMLGPVDAGQLIAIAGISTVAISAPILLLQWGITLARPLHSAIIISALPVVVLAADVLLGAQLTASIGVAMSLLVAVLLFGLRRGA